MEEKLIQAVRGRPLLYDTSHADYMKVKLKSQNWEQIADEAGIVSGPEAKRLWEKLRHSLRDALRRKQKSMKNGVPASTLRAWKYETEMAFLLPYMAARKKDDSDEESNWETAMKACYSQDASNGTEAASDEDGTSEVAVIFPEYSTDNFSKRHLDSPHDIPIENTPQKRIKKEGSVDFSFQQQMENQDRRSSEILAERSRLLERNQPPNDPLYYFFLSMYESTKRMPPASQLVVRNHIYRAVSDMEATLLGIHPTDASRQSPF